jgi:hypothetical protein
VAVEVAAGEGLTKGVLSISILVMITIPTEIKTRYKPASLPGSKPDNQSLGDFLLAKMDEADVIADIYPVTYTHEEVFVNLRKRYTEPVDK